MQPVGFDVAVVIADVVCLVVVVVVVAPVYHPACGIELCGCCVWVAVCGDVRVLVSCRTVSLWPCHGVVGLHLWLCVVLTQYCLSLVSCVQRAC